MTSPPGPHRTERATLSRDLADFLTELSVALHRHAMYPQGHPSLAPAAAALARRVGQLLETRAALSVGVARHQLVIEGVATDAKHAIWRELAGRLHRHHLGAVTFQPGVDADEIGDVLKTLAVDPERAGQPLGLGPPERLHAWSHLQLHALAYERLGLVEVGSGEPRAAQLWVGLAQAALALPPGQDVLSLEAGTIARAIDAAAQGGDGPSEQAIGGYLVQLAAELKTSGGGDALALRRQVSALIRSLTAETLRRLVEMGGDLARRRQFLADAATGLAADAVLEIVKAAAEASHQTISHSLVRLLTKLAAQAEGGASDVRGVADAALRTQVRRLLDGWTLPDPNPDAYSAALQRMTRATPRPPAAGDTGYPAQPGRVIAMALEADVSGTPVLAAVDRLLEEGRLSDVVERLERVSGSSGAATAVWERIATPDVIRRLVAREPVDFRMLDRLVPRAGVAAAVPLLDALATAESRGTRRGLLGHLARLGAAVGPIAVERLDDPRWYVTRNLLALLEELPAVPAGFSPARWT
ncbi:MAG TPA: hypothetical protein VFI66_04630, partial [Gemmatimonadales bacterium]|nr:hypothetical protein [Gemmatimonadales bacterium]